VRQPAPSALFTILRFFLSTTVLCEGHLQDVPISDVPAIHFPFKVYLPHTLIRAV
jgi:hypothetical protein